MTDVPALFDHPSPPEAPPTEKAAIPADLIPGYEILERLGQGGMGTVHKARQLGLDRLVAVKFLAPELSKDPEYVQRFLTEARTAGKLRHLNIVSALDCGSVRDLRYLVMEFVEGRTLASILKERGTVDERVALEIVKQVAEGLDHAWRHGIIHRDIKPQNLMMTPEGVVKICDFGLCKAVHRDARLTSTGYVNCTPSHASPEQIRGDKDLDCRTDLYSLGITLHQLLTGRLPFEGASPGDFAVKHATAERVGPHLVNPRVSAGVGALVVRMISVDRNLRPSSPAELAGAIRSLLGTAQVPAPPAGKPAAPPKDIIRLAGIDLRADLALSVRQADGAVVVGLQGKLLEAMDQRLQQELFKLAEGRQARAVVDCSRLEYLNSRAVSVFIAAVDVFRAAGGDLRLAAVSSQARVILDRLGVTLILRHFPTVEEAVASFAADPVEAPSVPPEIAKVTPAPPAPAPRPAGPVPKAAKPISPVVGALVLAVIVLGTACALLLAVVFKESLFRGYTTGQAMFLTGALLALAVLSLLAWAKWRYERRLKLRKEATLQARRAARPGS